MQMALVLVTGHAMASSALIKRMLSTIASKLNIVPKVVYKKYFEFGVK